MPSAGFAKEDLQPGGFLTAFCAPFSVVSLMPSFSQRLKAVELALLKGGEAEKPCSRLPPWLKGVSTPQGEAEKANKKAAARTVLFCLLWLSVFGGEVEATLGESEPSYQKYLGEIGRWQNCIEKSSRSTGREFRRRGYNGGRGSRSGHKRSEGSRSGHKRRWQRSGHKQRGC